MKQPEYAFGANILESLTTGMYQDSKVIYREYIQNACDQIDEAIETGLLREGEGVIEIWLDNKTRTISIEDNATGIPKNDFQKTLCDIANSKKKIGQNKGFRGIGRLCGLAYCREVVFSASAKGENVISIMRCNAAKMRTLLTENAKGNKLTATEVLMQVNEFSTEKTTDVDSHFFKVELIDINAENTDLLNEGEIRDCLSFVAPVYYQSTFIFREDIYKHAQELGIKLDEYTIKLEGKQIFKKFNTFLKKPDGDSRDEIFDVAFQDFYDDDNNLFAWMWIGLSKFTGAIPKVNLMRGLRLRKENIQIGSEDALQKLFKEDRGNSYFVGEVFAISDDLIPNSQRDYFNENPTRAYFEKTLKRFFDEKLHKLYYDGSAVNSAFNKITAYETKEAEFIEKQNTGAFVSDAHRETEFSKIENAKKTAEDALKKINNIKKKAGEEDDSWIGKVINRIEQGQPPKPIKDNSPSAVAPVSAKPKHRTDSPKLSTYNKNERKLISKIFELILSATDDKTAENIICKIEEGLSQ